MKFVSLLFIFVFYFTSSISKEFEDMFFVGKMESYNQKFTLYFKTREKAVLARGQYSNYITDYPQDLYLFNNETEKTKPLITYDWFPNKAKSLISNYEYPVFPEDYAYYLLNDNRTLIMISGIKSIRSNFKFNLHNNKLEKLPKDNNYKLFVSSLLKDCGYKDINSTYKCSFYKPLISENLIN